MGIKLCDLTISELRDLLLANERAIGPHAASTQIIRRELERKSPPGRKPLRLSRSEDGREDRP